MAHTNGFPERPREASHEPIFDIYIDPAFGNDDICRKKRTKQEFAREPWLHYRNAKDTYFSIRYDKREEFLDHLKKQNAPERVRLDEEIDRINHVRLRMNSSPDKRALITELESSRKEWKADVVKNLNSYIKKVERAREAQGEHGNADSDLALLRRIRGGQSIDAQTPVQQSHTAPPLAPEFGFKAGVMYFKRMADAAGYLGHDYEPEQCEGHFPHQKIPVHQILEAHPDNILRKRPDSDDGIRYFHFPSNNMSWIERAMARYYGEANIEPDDHKPMSNMSDCERVLSREFWRGQMHGSGGRAPVHARHMRSRCSVIPRAAAPSRSLQGVNQETTSRRRSSQISKVGKNLGLFMPYLHWETDSRRANMGRIIKDEARKNETGPGAARKQTRDFLTLLQQKTKKSKSWSGKGSKLLREKKKNPLLKYLVHVAKVASAIDHEADEELIRENLFKNPPMHVRRTLDQYYFLTLDDTSARDRDQVVYRETGAGLPGAGRTSRVVMVDQLWLWILDDNTIITSFPKRWGTNKPDSSGVHKCLRMRLASEQEIKSVYHLALIIIDECSRVFFDRTKPLDQRPEVIDLFGSAIGRVTEHTTDSFDNFWSRTALYSWNFLPSELPGSRNKYLEINPEGILLKESQDIVEELNIMHQIFSQQAQTVKTFRRYLGVLNGDDRADVKTIMNGLMSAVRSARQESTLSIDDTIPEPEPPRAPRPLDDTVQEADILLELIDSRQAELQDLKDSALRTCQQLEQLLSLKQQQASIVEAKAALLRADESIKQGRAIMAFTLVTIFFLPLGFFAAFFGMNNQQSTGNEWMTLPEQINYMFMLSSIVVLLSVSIAFSSWVRVVLTLTFRIPLKKVADSVGLHRLWVFLRLDYVNLERKKMRSLEDLALKGLKKDKARRKRDEDKSKQYGNGAGEAADSHSEKSWKGSLHKARQVVEGDSV